MKTYKLEIIVKPNTGFPVSDDLAREIAAQMDGRLKSSFEPDFTLVSCKAYVHEEKTEGELAEEFIASSPTEEPTKEAPLHNPTTEEYEAAPTPPTPVEGGIRELSDL